MTERVSFQAGRWILLMASFVLAGMASATTPRLEVVENERLVYTTVKDPLRSGQLNFQTELMALKKNLANIPYSSGVVVRYREMRHNYAEYDVGVKVSDSAKVTHLSSEKLAPKRLVFMGKSADFNLMSRTAFRWLQKQNLQLSGHPWVEYNSLGASPGVVVIRVPVL